MDSYFSPCNLPIFLLLLPMLALSALPLTSRALSAVKVPEFILEFIRQKPALSALYGALLLAFNLASLLYLFGVPYAVLQKARLISAWRESCALLNGKKLKTVRLLALCYLAAIVTVFLVAGVVILLLLAYVRITGGSEETFRFLAVSWGRAGGIAVSILGPAVLAAVSVLLYHRYRGDVPQAAVPAVRTVRSILSRTAMVVLSVILLLFSSETAMGGAPALPDGKSTLIIAHRAGAFFAPENTVAALEQDGADMAEIDVQ